MKLIKKKLGNSTTPAVPLAADVKPVQQLELIKEDNETLISKAIDSNL